MCGRYSIAVEATEIEKRFQARFEEPMNPRYNVCPEQTLPVIVRKDRNDLAMMRWGLVPSWSKEPKSLAINARIEGILTKPSFRKPIRSQRCLVPATGFYEWKKETSGKTPFYIHRKDGALFAFAGIFDEWHGGAGGPLRTFAIITTAPDDFMAQVHNRMPVILRPEQEQLWLTTEPAGIGHLLESLQLLPQEQMEMFPVSRMLNSARNDSRELIQKA